MLLRPGLLDPLDYPVSSYLPRVTAAAGRSVPPCRMHAGLGFRVRVLWYSESFVMAPPHDDATASPVEAAGSGRAPSGASGMVAPSSDPAREAGAAPDQQVRLPGFAPAPTQLFQQQQQQSPSWFQGTVGASATYGRPPCGAEAGSTPTLSRPPHFGSLSSQEAPQHHQRPPAPPFASTPLPYPAHGHPPSSYGMPDGMRAQQSPVIASMQSELAALRHQQQVSQAMMQRLDAALAQQRVFAAQHTLQCKPTMR